MAQRRDIEREQVEWVMRLTGGELSDVVWDRFKYWYEGIPEYANSDFGEPHDDEARYRTVVTDLVLPKSIDCEGIWILHSQFKSSGEAECPHLQETRDGKVTQEQCGEWRRCALCDEDIGEAHDTVDIGEEWVEAIYRCEEENYDDDEEEDDGGGEELYSQAMAGATSGFRYGSVQDLHHSQPRESSERSQLGLDRRTRSFEEWPYSRCRSFGAWHPGRHRAGSKRKSWSCH